MKLYFHLQLQTIPLEEYIFLGCCMSVPSVRSLRSPVAIRAVVLPSLIYEYAVI